MASQGESRLPGPVGVKDKRRSFLPAPKTKTTSTALPLPQPQPSQLPKQPAKSPDVVESTEKKPQHLQVGNRVLIGGIKYGVLRYFGRTHFAEGEWCGIELEEPEGKHDGTIEGVRYFHCPEPHGIFAPQQKVELTSPVEDAYTGAEDKGKTETKISRLKQPKTRGLPQPKSVRSQNASPNHVSPVDDEEHDSREPSPTEGQPAKFQSKLAKPKAVVKPLSCAEKVKPNTESGNVDTNSGEHRGIPKPSKLPLQPGRGAFAKKKGPDEKSEKKEVEFKLPKLSSVPKAGQKTSPKAALNETYELNLDKKSCDEYDSEFPIVTTPSRVDAHTALTLAFDLENSGSDSENRKQLNLTFEVNKQSPPGKKPASIQSPLPDLLTPAYYGRGDPEDFIYEDPVVPEENFDLMTESMISTASSLGLLGEVELNDESLLTDDLKEFVGGDEGLDDSKDATELMEKDLERELAGATPDTLDLTGSTISYRTETSSPDSELPKQEFDLSFEAAAPGMSSTPAVEEEEAAGQKVIGADGDGPSFQPILKDIEQHVADITYTVQNTSGDSSITEEDLGRTFVVRDADRLNESLEDSASSKTSCEVSDSSGAAVANQENLHTTYNLAEPKDNAKTPMDQFTDLMQESRPEGVQDQAHAEIQGVQEVEEVVEHCPVLTSEIEPEIEVKCARLVQAEIMAVKEQEQLFTDLQNGHKKNERPVSLVSTGSADTGIGGELPGMSGHKDRPLSMVSSSSVDTGIMGDMLSPTKREMILSAAGVDAGHQAASEVENGEHAGGSSHEVIDLSEVEPQTEGQKPAEISDTVVPENVERLRLMNEAVQDVVTSHFKDSTSSAGAELESDVEEPVGDAIVEIGEEASGTESQQEDDNDDGAKDLNQPKNEDVAIPDSVEDSKTPTEEVLTEPEDVESEIIPEEGLATVHEEPEPFDHEDENRSLQSISEKNSPRTPLIEVIPQDKPESVEDSPKENVSIIVEERDNREMQESMERAALIQIEVIPSAMSESTAKDAGGEKDPSQKEDNAGEVSVVSDEHDESESKSSEVDTDKVDSSKVDSDKTDSEPDKSDTKEVKAKHRKEIKNGKVNGKGDKDKSGSKSVRDTEKTPVKGKTPSKLTKATPKKGDQPDKATPRKPNTKVGSRLADYIKSPIIPRSKDENAKNEVNGKLSKNALNKKKADMAGNSSIIDKRTLISPKGDNYLNKRRASAPVAPVTKVDLNTSSKSSKSVISENEDDSPTKPVKRNPPKSKWDNIMSKIEHNKGEKKTKAKPEVKSRIGAPTGTGTAPARSNVGTSKTNTGTGPVKLTTSSRRYSSPAVGSDSSKAANKATPKVSSPRSSRLTPEPGRLSSRVSSASDVSGPENSRASSNSRPGSRPASTSKPGNRATTTLRRERSPSAGSDSQLSSISQVSSQGAKGLTTPRGKTKETTPERKLAAKNIKRKSLIETSSPQVANSTEPRRSSLSVRGRETTKSRSPQPTASSTPRKPLNQNRNKPIGKSGSSKQSANHPDVVAQSVANANAAAEISRLEALCEARTKELTYAKMQIRSGMAGFEAMSILVKYLTEELDAFSCPMVKAKLEDLQIQLAQAQTQLEELRQQKVALEAEIVAVNQEHAKQTEKLQTQHQGELDQLQERLKEEHELDVKKVEEKHSEEVKTLKNTHEENVTELKQQNEEQIQDKEREHNDSMGQLRKEHENRLTELQQQHETKLEEITMRFENIKLTLSEKVEFLRTECEELRRREKTYMEACQRDSDLKVQNYVGSPVHDLALAPYKHLPQEIESLKAVMEMRNQEIRNLRLQKLELEKQLEHLPNATKKVNDLTQKVENLEAIVSMKAEYERQLAEKHQIILRKLDRESKTNKRLSMDNEELAWRLSQGETGSPDVVRRTISHSPTSSCASTPEPSRRRKSPRSPNPQSPSSAFDFEDKSPKSPQRTTNLKRSGTYDLLNQEFDEEDKPKDMKQSDV